MDDDEWIVVRSSAHKPILKMRLEWLSKSNTYYDAGFCLGVIQGKLDHRTVVIGGIFFFLKDKS